jgi:hypothetical protein
MLIGENMGGPREFISVDAPSGGLSCVVRKKCGSYFRIKYVWHGFPGIPTYHNILM